MTAAAKVCSCHLSLRRRKVDGSGCRDFCRHEADGNDTDSDSGPKVQRFSPGRSEAEARGTEGRRIAMANGPIVHAVQFRQWLHIDAFTSWIQSPVDFTVASGTAQPRTAEPSARKYQSKAAP